MRACFLCQAARLWSPALTQGLSNLLHPHPCLLHAWVAAWWSVCLCLQRQRRIQAPSATMNLNPGQRQPLVQHLCGRGGGGWWWVLELWAGGGHAGHGPVAPMHAQQAGGLPRVALDRSAWAPPGRLAAAGRDGTVRLQPVTAQAPAFCSDWNALALAAGAGPGQATHGRGHRRIGEERLFQGRYSPPGLRG
jgi:hypothetical protein